MAHSYTNFLDHRVFATKDRQPLLEPAIAERLHAYLGGIREEGGTTLIIHGIPNLVHILAQLRVRRKPSGPD